MLKQIFYYELTIFKLNDFSININALFLIVILLISLKFKNKIFRKAIYLLIIIGFSNIFVFTQTNNLAIDFEVFSKASFFVYNILNHPITSMNTFFMVYSHLNIIIFIPFYLIYKKHRYFVSYVMIFSFLQILFINLNIASSNFNLYFILLNIIGYTIGFLLNYLGGNYSEAKNK